MTAKLKGKQQTEGMGRPSKFTSKRRQDIIEAIRNRIPYEFAAEANGISERTLYYWLELGHKHQLDEVDSDYADFLQSIKRAEMDKVRHHLDIISARPERWQAEAWILERRWPKHFGNNVMLKELNEKMNKVLGVENEGNDVRNREDD